MDEKDRQKQIRTFFEEEAARWDVLTRRYEPRYDEMLSELVSRVRLPKALCKVLDLGCGTGNLASLILEKYPGAEIICADTSAKMLQMATAKLGQYGKRVSLIEADFDQMPPGPFQAVVSTLALHHLGTDAEKQRQYNQIFNSLSAGGCFWNGDITLCSSEEDSISDELLWMDWLRENNFSEEEVKTTIERAHINDRPAPLVAQLTWLQNIGFTKVDCTWRYMGYAVYGGWRQK